MPSSSEAGLPSTVATGRSSTWWLRNQALPSTQAFLALVILWPSTVSSMSSQTQPQKVQVALLTIFSSVADIGPGSLTFRGEWERPDAGKCRGQGRGYFTIPDSQAGCEPATGWSP